jgi:uncharacterized protein YkwD
LSVARFDDATVLARRARATRQIGTVDAIRAIFLWASILPVALLAQGPAPALEREPAELFWKRPELARAINLDAPDNRLLVAAVFQETNRRRREHHLPPLEPDERLDAAADGQARTMALMLHISHESPLKGHVTPADRVRAAGLNPSFVAENVATTPLLSLDGAEAVRREGTEGQVTFVFSETGRSVPAHTYASIAAALLDRWMESPGHRANILNPAGSHLGCGVCGAKGVGELPIVYVAQIFCAPRETSARDPEATYDARVSR